MNRCIALLLALLCASLTVSSACVAASGDWIEFEICTRAQAMSALIAQEGAILALQ